MEWWGGTGNSMWCSAQARRWHAAPPATWEARSCPERGPCCRPHGWNVECLWGRVSMYLNRTEAEGLTGKWSRDLVWFGLMDHLKQSPYLGSRIRVSRRQTEKEAELEKNKGCHRGWGTGLSNPYWAEGTFPMRKPLPTTVWCLASTFLPTTLV